MFNWWSRQQRQTYQEQQAEEPLDLERLPELDTAILFKHSLSCPVSWFAETEVKAFRETHPSVPVYTIQVRRDRELSRKIAALTNVTHESPQVIVLRRGAVVAAASHGDVTADYLSRVLTQSVS